jgi:hypothetical protein
LTRRRACLLATIALAIVSAAVDVAPPAVAAFTSNPSHPTSSVSTATLAAPTSLSASCFLLTPTHIRLNWTATSSAWADGYEIFRGTVSGGPYSSVGTVSGQGTTTFDNTRPSGSTTYYYVVKSTKQLWRSVNSNQAQTPGICIL